MSNICISLIIFNEEFKIYTSPGYITPFKFQVNSRVNSLFIYYYPQAFPRTNLNELFFFKSGLVDLR